MSKLSTLTLVVFAFSPLLLTVALVGCIGWIRSRSSNSSSDFPRWLLGVVVRLMASNRHQWGVAMLAELDHVHDRSRRWQFALGCAKVALFSPATFWPGHWFDAFWRLEPKCGVLSVSLPPLGLPLLLLAAFAAEHFTTHDDFFNGELVPGLIGTFILSAFACVLAGVPFGIAGIVRRERSRWLSLAGPVLSVAIFSYMMIVQHIANSRL